ncbi:MAG: hypothetical protein ACJA1A_003597, partial [Saprospiraceae bacterium]
GSHGKIVYEVDLASIGFVKFMHIMNKKLGIDEARYDIASLNSVSNYYRCPYFMMNAMDLKRALFSFECNLKYSASDYIREYELSLPNNMNLQQASFAINMYCNKLFKTAILANRVMNSTENPQDIDKLWASYGYKSLSFGQMFFESIKALEINAYLEFFCAMHMLAAPPGLNKVEEILPQDQFDSFYAPGQISSLKMINKLPASDWLQA